MGIDALFIASGIHNDVMVGGKIDPQRLASLFEPADAPPAIAATAQLRW